jgi:heme-degrading monooxygenase HmoA
VVGVNFGWSTSGAVIVRLDVFGVRGLGIAKAFLHMGLDRPRLRAITPRPTFWKLLGTGSGETFTMRDADPRHWALLTVWDEDDDAQRFAESKVVRSWAQRANEQATVLMEPIASHGTWAGRTPFTADPALGRSWNGPVAAITRARIRPSQWRSFWSSVPPVSTDLRNDPAVLATLGIGEAPVGLQGTFSIWRSAEAIRAFAYQRPEHAAVITRTHERQWYSEELFARFAVRSAEGTVNGSMLVP